MDPSERLQKEKSALRERMRLRLKSLSEDELAEGRVGVHDQLAQCEPLRRFPTLLAYYPTRNEVDCRDFLRAWRSSRHALVLPRVADDGVSLEVRWVSRLEDLAPGYRGILEPDSERCPSAEADRLGAVLVPGLAFDLAGRRLGQGGGHYDRFLARLPKRVVTIGLAYDWQVIDTVPAGELDQRVQYLATPTRFLRAER